MKKVRKDIIIPREHTPKASIVKKIREFLKKFKTIEEKNGSNHIVLFDQKSKAFYLNCHLDSKIISSKTDLDAVLDPEESEDYKLNRGLYEDTYAYRRMENDAIEGRSFEDLVVEYDTSYRSDRPLKVFGGQHRIEAIRKAAKKNVHVAHGIRVYFVLTSEQKLDIAVANNTSIAVSNDLLDRMQEELLGCDLRDWCQNVGLLEKGQNFADKRNSEGIPTVRVARTIVVNFQKGKQADDKDFHMPVVCSSGPGIDQDYQTLRQQINWTDSALKTMGRQIARLHKLQRERVLGRKTDNYLEFANKTMHLCVAASWAYTAGYLQRLPEDLKKHYVLADVEPHDDPLGAKALSTARLKGVDPDTYRGLGARISAAELGRMFEVFYLQATKAKERGITKKLANAAITSFEAKRAARDRDRVLKGI